LGLKDKGQIGIALAIGVLAWGASALFDKDRRFLHDRLAGTRLVSLPKAGQPVEAAGEAA
jgi:uncharacterized RDD family membrane protein YckC